MHVDRSRSYQSASNIRDIGRSRPVDSRSLAARRSAPSLQSSSLAACHWLVWDGGCAGRGTGKGSRMTLRSRYLVMEVGSCVLLEAGK